MNPIAAPRPCVGFLHGGSHSDIPSKSDGASQGFQPYRRLRPTDALVPGRPRVVTAAPASVPPPPFRSPATSPSPAGDPAALRRPLATLPMPNRPQFRGVRPQLHPKPAGRTVPPSNNPADVHTILIGSPVAARGSIVWPLVYYGAIAISVGDRHCNDAASHRRASRLYNAGDTQDETHASSTHIERTSCR